MSVVEQPTDLDRRRARLIDRRRRAIVLDAGPSHPEFGSAFMRYYLPHYLTNEGQWVQQAPWHDELFRVVFGSLGTGCFNVYEVHREGAKSTVASLGITLAALGLKLKDYVWLVHETAPQAKQSMEAILAETETNPRVRQDFPHLVPMLGKHNRPLADRDDDVIFSSGQRLQALGAGQKLRGRRHRQHRPDLAVIDDLENDESVLTKYQRDKLDNWTSSALMGALAKGADLHMLGTPLHSDAVLRRFQKRARAKVLKYPAATDWRQCGCYQGPFVDVEVPPWGYGLEDCPECDGIGYLGEPTWPAWWPMRRLADKREDVGATPFSREYLLVVTDETRKRFPKRFMQEGERPTAVEGDDGTVRGVSVRIGVDPAIGEKKENDRSAIVTAMRRRGERRFHVDDAWADRVRGSKLKSRVLAVYQRYRELGYNPVVVFEKVQAQAWGAEALEDEGVQVKPVLPSDLGGGDKLVRAEGASVHYEEGRVTHAAKLRDGDFEGELDEFPDGEHDDYVDALVYALWALSEPDGGGGVAGTVDHGKTKPTSDGLPKGVGAHPHDPRFA